MSTHFYPRPSFSRTESIFDQTQLAELRHGVSRNQGGSEAEQRQIAQQFEALFIQQILKQARATASGSGMFNSSSVQMAQSMSDEQMALHLSQSGMGLADALMAQMRGDQDLRNGTNFARYAPEANSSRDPALRSRVGESARMYDASSITNLLKKLLGPNTVDQVASAVRGAPKHVSDFVAKIQDMAERVAQNTGVPVKLLMSQAALESGWGKREIVHDNGHTTHNLFGIKATPNWKGKVAHILTTEYENGEYIKVRQSFRAYDSYEESLTDYARLISDSPRYQSVMTANTPQEAAKRVQEAGYATDPNYAQKLISIMAYFDSGSR